MDCISRGRIPSSHSGLRWCGSPPPPGAFSATAEWARSHGGGYGVADSLNSLRFCLPCGLALQPGASMVGASHNAGMGVLAHPLALRPGAIVVGVHGWPSRGSVLLPHIASREN